MTEAPPPTDGDPEDTHGGNFWGWLRDHKNGALHSELSEKLAELGLAVLEHEKQGSLTLTITVKPTKDGATTFVTDDVKSNVPTADRGGSIMFVDEDGSLVRQNPRQMSLPMRVVKETQAGEPVVIDTETGEVRELG